MIHPLPRFPRIEKVCAWCQRERGEQSQPHQSHGICKAHKAAVLGELKTFKR